ncbi:MAG: hypothetical protein IID35_10830 [Planctomycetes bacterium]|nr:hypothetical protein [Planctomycetota bacterium]
MANRSGSVGSIAGKEIMARRRRKKRSKNPAVNEEQARAPRGVGHLRWSRRIGFSLVPVVVLIGGAEVALRLGEWAKPTMRNLPLPAEYAGLFEPDDELFWSPGANLEITYRGVTVRTNDLGLRTRDVAEKPEGQFRILSLGESSTFGIGVENDETYSALLEELLRDGFGSASVRVINAGVPAYSSFQSVQYLKTRGLALEPDLVLFYHEVNDYLPSTFRDGSNTEVGISSSDKQLYHSRSGGLARRLLRYSALHRFITYRVARGRIRALQASPSGNPLAQIGLPDIGLPSRIVETVNGKDTEPTLNARSLPRRVTSVERTEILEELVSICHEHGIQLVIIHPSYRESSPHTCELTRLCNRRGVTMYDARGALHPNDAASMFLDAWHPTTIGHRRLANGLAEFLLSKNLIRQAG